MVNLQARLICFCPLGVRPSGFGFRLGVHEPTPKRLWLQVQRVACCEGGRESKGWQGLRDADGREGTAAMFHAEDD